MIRRKRVIPLLFALASFAAHAKDLTAYMEASQIFSEKVNIAVTQHAMPRLTDADAGPLIMTLSDHRRFLDGHDFTQAELNGLISVCHTANQLSVAYALFDLNRRVDRTSQGPDVARQTGEVVMQNTYAFQQELALIQPFLLRCMAKQLGPLSEMVTALAPEARAKDTRLARLRGMLEGISANYTGMFALVADDRLSAAYKRAMLEALSDVAETVQTAMPLAARQRVLADMSALDPAAKAPFGKYFERIEVAMRKSACEGLCALE